MALHGHYAASSTSIFSFLVFLTYCALNLLRMALSVAALREEDVHSSSPCIAVQHSNTHPHFNAHPQTLLSRIILLGCNMTPECFFDLTWLSPHQVEAEGDVATAFTLARILSNIPLSRGGPASVVIFDIHALQVCP